jgi:hypothetical protein
MRVSSLLSRGIAPVALVILLAIGAVYVASAQSQEPRPGATTNMATPAVGQEDSITGLPETGVIDSSWQGPNWGLRLAWDPATWTVENELIERGYDGLQLGTSASTVYIEAYKGFAGDADACLADAEREIGERERVVEAAPLSGRRLPSTGATRGPSQLFGIIAELPDGERYRGIEYIECRTLVPGSAVLEITWQAASGVYNGELPRVEALLATIETSGAALPSTPTASPMATPVARSGAAAT